MKKICTKCKKNKDFSEFTKGNDKYGLRRICKSCEKDYREANKEKIALYQKQYRILNKEKLTTLYKNYRVKNRDFILENKKKSYKNNIDKIKEYNKKNKTRISAKMKECFNKSADYAHFYKKLTSDEQPMLSKDGVSLEVKCRYCDQYFVPTKTQVRHRIAALCSSSSIGDKYLYCSDSCKAACPVYNQHKYPKGFKKATSREVNPLVRQMCFERDNWECQTCGATQSEAPLHCHHIEGYAQNPRLGNDVTNTITLCKTCHKEVHRLPGCNYYELRCKKD